jgi:radical SAM-linked protein
MIGRPTETEADLKALVDLVKSLRQIKKTAGRRGKINVSVATFIPKPHTPFQWAAQLPLAESQERIRWLQGHLKVPWIHFKWQDPKVSWLEGVWARGDRRMSRLLVAAYQKGCRFDGWSDLFRYDLWQAVFKEQGIDPYFFTIRERDVCESLPWDHIDTRVTREFLAAEWENARKGAYTADCRVDDCNQCGVCDFEQIAPLTHDRFKNAASGVPPGADQKAAAFQKLTVFYTKRDQARYFGHLEMVNIFQRALKRAGIAVRFSEGFHPKPKISFDDPLPVGIESQQERFTLFVPDDLRPRQVKDLLNAHLPAGLSITDCRLAPGKSPRDQHRRIRYRVDLAEGQFDEELLKVFNAQPAFTITLRGRKGKLKKIELKDIVVNSELRNSGHLELTLLTEPGKNVRPFEVLRHIFKLSETQIKQAIITKLREA